MKRAISTLIIALLLNVVIGSNALAVTDSDTTNAMEQATIQRTLTPLPASVVDLITEQRDAGNISADMADRLLNPPPDQAVAVGWFLWMQCFFYAYATLTIAKEFLAWYYANYPDGPRPGPGGSGPGNLWSPPLDL